MQSCWLCEPHSLPRYQGGPDGKKRFRVCFLPVIIYDKKTEILAISDS